MGTFSIYAITLLIAVSVLAAILRSKEAPGPAYVVLGLTVGFLLMFVLIDSGRIDEIPGIRVGETDYRLLDQLEEARKNADQQQATRLVDLESRVAALESKKGQVPAEHLEAGKFSRILWVDDHPLNNEVLVKFLKERNTFVREVESTEKAVAELQADGPRFDAVITDMGRDHPDSRRKNDRAGLDLLREVNQLRPGTPVFFYSSRADLEHEALKSGAKLFTSSSNQLLSALGFGAGAP